MPRPDRLTPRKETTYPLYGRLGGSQARSGRQLVLLVREKMLGGFLEFEYRKSNTERLNPQCAALMSKYT